MDAQIWFVTIHQKTARGGSCRQEILVLAADQQEASRKAAEKADKSRQIVTIDAEPQGESFWFKH